MKRPGLRLSGAVLGAVATTLLVYLWILGSTNGLPAIGGRQSDYDNLLAHGFLSGHLYLDTPVPDQLLQLANPYDPKLRPPGLGLHDASLYLGKYYIYFGPVPVVLLMLPFAVLTGQDLPIGYAVGLFAFATYLALLAIFWRYRRIYRPDAGPWATAACLLALGACSFQFPLLTRHTMYELPIACGAACFLWGLYCLLRGGDATRRLAWCAGGGLLLGLAVAARPIYLFASVLVFLPFTRPRGFRPVLAAAGACGVIVVLLLWYNFARFGRFSEFGQNFQLSGAVEGQVRHFAIANLPFNARVYLLAPFQWGRYFPFVRRIVVPPYPAHFGGYEEAFGLLPNLPFYGFAAAGLAFTAFPPKSISTRQWVELSGLTAAAIILFLVLGGFFGSVVRYMSDFSPAWLLVAVCGVVEIDRHLPSPRGRTAFGIAATALAVGSAGVALLSTFYLYRDFAAQAPAEYAALGRALNRPVAWAERLTGSPNHGALHLRVSFPFHPAHPREPLVSTGWTPNLDSVWVEYLPAESVRFLLVHGHEAPIVSPPYILGTEPVHDLTISLGSLYPPPTHPYFRDFTPGQVGAKRTFLWLALDGKTPWLVHTGFFDSTPGTITLGRDRGNAERFSGQILASERCDVALPDAPLPSRDLEFGVTLREEWAGRSFPLVVAGQTEAADIVFLRVLAGGRVQFGYDHWGKLARYSLPLSGLVGHPLQLEVRLPEKQPEGGWSPLVIRNGSTVLWTRAVSVYAAAPYEIYPLVNPVGASTCEVAFPESHVLTVR